MFIIIIVNNSIDTNRATYLAKWPEIISAPRINSIQGSTDAIEPTNELERNR